MDNHLLTLAVASGKGGTGKTTLATNLAATAARAGIKTRYLDCDVEEPNGRIFLKPEIHEDRPVTVPVPKVDHDKCTGCGKCGEICRFNAILVAGNNVLTFHEMCHSCSACSYICPENAITEQPRLIGHVHSGKAGEVEFHGGTLDITSIRTPTLIDEVKKNLAGDALNIIDAPPGTSCPAIEAVRGVDHVLLVTDPTPFALHDMTLAADMLDKMNLPFTVVINRSNNKLPEMDAFFERTGAERVPMLVEDPQIASVCSKGELVVEKLPRYEQNFISILEKVTDSHERNRNNKR